VNPKITKIFGRMVHLSQLKEQEKLKLKLGEAEKRLEKMPK